MGKKRIIAETGAGQHGVATATVAALFGLECDVYMGEEDMRRQELNVFRMRLLGAEVLPVTSGSGTLKDAINEAIRDWVANVETTHYIIGSVVGPGSLSRHGARFPDRHRPGDARADPGQGRPAARRPRRLRGRGSNAIGIFHAFLDDPDVRLVGVEAAGLGLDTGKHGASLARGAGGILHGSYSYVLQDADGQIQEAHSVAAGLDYPSVGPEHAFLKDSGRVEYTSVTDERGAWRPSRRSPGWRASSRRWRAPTPSPTCWRAITGSRADDVVVVSLSGRGDKDVYSVAGMLGVRSMSASRSSRLTEVFREAGQPAAHPLRGGGLSGSGLVRATSCAPTRGAAPASWRSACRSRTRWPMGRSSRPPRRWRCRPAIRPADVLDLAGEVAAEGVPGGASELSQHHPGLRPDTLLRPTAARKGVAGVVVPDVPVEEAGDLQGTARGAGVDVILLAAPTSTDARLARIAAAASGFIYCVSTTGVTGARAALQRRSAGLRGPGAAAHRSASGRGVRRVHGRAGGGGGPLRGRRHRRERVGGNGEQEPERGADAAPAAVVRGRNLASGSLRRRRGRRGGPRRRRQWVMRTPSFSR